MDEPGSWSSEGRPLLSFGGVARANDEPITLRRCLSPAYRDHRRLPIFIELVICIHLIVFFAWIFTQP